MIIQYQLEIDSSSVENKEICKNFQKEVEYGMNLYYDLWTLIFDPFNDYQKIKEYCLEINKFNEYLAKKFNSLAKSNLKNERNVLLYEQYLSNYVNDRNYAKFITDGFENS